MCQRLHAQSNLCETLRPGLFWRCRLLERGSWRIEQKGGGSAAHQHMYQGCVTLGICGVSPTRVGLSAEVVKSDC